MTATVGVRTSRAAPEPAPARRRRASDRAFVVIVVIAANAAVTLGLWLRHGELSAMSGAGGVAIAAGQLTALAGTYAVLVQLLLMARVPWLERRIGLDRLAVWHRWLGFAVVWLLVGHTALTTLGYAQSVHVSVVAQTRDFIAHYPDVLMAFIGLGILLAVGISSVRAARRKLSREAWYSIHLYAYLAVALTFAHQLAVGTDFSEDRVARLWWIALYVAVFGSILWWRVGWPLRFNARHALRVRDVRREIPGVVSIYLTGRRLAELDVQSGQFFLWRFLTRDRWWKAHPFSLSAAPTKRGLRITVKDLGDDSGSLPDVPKGTRVFAEGPYGTFTEERRSLRKVLLIAGGIGITPLRALLATIAADPGDVTLLYRAVSAEDVIFRSELADIGDRRGVTIHALLGSEIGDDQPDQLGIPAITALVPDVLTRDVFVCGPPGLVDAVRRRLRHIGVPHAQIHFERFEF